MSDSRSLLGLLAVLCLAAAGLTLSALGAPAGAPAQRAAAEAARYGSHDAGARALPPAAALRFAPGIAASDQQVVLRAIGEARPQARDLVDLVAGLVTISLGDLGDGVAGQTRPSAGGYEVVLDLGDVHRTTGMRGVRRLVLHELAHVVDHALVGTALEAQLDAATPPGFGCDGGSSAGCAAREERFAESFAKWATGDAGHDLQIGYRVPPPRSLADWGAPLSELAR